MELATSQVDLECIEIRGDFPKPEPEQVTYLAHAIAAVGGLIQVPVVKQVDLETYELVSGYFEYQAYLKAREIDSKLPDRMRVFIITQKNQKAIQQQLEVFETLADGNSSPDSNGAVSPDLSIRLNNLVSAIELLQKDVKTSAIESKDAILEAIDERLPKPLPPLESFNRISEPQVAQQTLEKLNAALGNSKAQQIVQNLQKYRKKKPEQPLSRFAEVIEAVGKDSRGKRLLTELTMLKVIDTWE